MVVQSAGERIAHSDVPRETEGLGGHARWLQSRWNCWQCTCLAR